MSKETSVQLYIGGRWCDAAESKIIPVVNPANQQRVATVAKAGRIDLDRALAAAQAGFELWRDTPAVERSDLLRRAAANLRNRIEPIAAAITREEGKPLAEARAEAAMSAEAVDWFAEEARRIYGRVIPPRRGNIQQTTTREPLGPVAAFTPWNYPVSQAVRKISAALAAGCSIILKGPEETPSSCAAMVRCFSDAGVPDGVVNLVFGVPAEISEYLIPHPVIRKVSFTGSTLVGKHLAGMAGHYMKPVSMELGGHSPAVVFNDADVEDAARLLCALKYDNTGQSCIAPTRFLIQDRVYDRFVESFVAEASQIVVGDGMQADTTMGPMANDRRVFATERYVQDAQELGGELLLGGERIGNAGYFYKPTVIANATNAMAGMNEEPFGPVAFLRRFSDTAEVMPEVNRLSYGLATYFFTNSSDIADQVANQTESGMVSINHFGLGLAETPFGGMKDSGFGAEGGTEGIEAYLKTKFVTRRSRGWHL